MGREPRELPHVSNLFCGVSEHPPAPAGSPPLLIPLPHPQGLPVTGVSRNPLKWTLDDRGVGRSRQLHGGGRRSSARACTGDAPQGDPDTSFPGTGAPGAYLLEPLDLVLQLDLSGPGVELAEAGGRAAAPARPLAVQLVHLQVLQLLPQVLDELRGKEAGWQEHGLEGGGRPGACRPTSCVASRSFWNSRRLCRNLSIMRLYRSISSLSRRLVSSSRSDMRCRSCSQGGRGRGRVPRGPTAPWGAGFAGGLGQTT